MGLDVFLYHYDDFADTQRREQEYEARSNAVWGDGDYNAMTEEFKVGCRAQIAAIAAELSLGEYGEATNKQKIEINSASYPDHYFKVGYFRSSYNASGINRILAAKIDTSLDEIMGASDEYCFQPKWQECKVRAQAALDKLRVANKEFPYRAMEIHADQLGPGRTPVTDEASALEVFREQKSRRPVEERDDFANYSSGIGEFFFGEPPVFRAFIPGQRFNTRVVWGVYEEKGAEWYEHALEIVIETCDYVLSQPDVDKYWLHWSG